MSSAIVIFPCFSGGLFSTGRGARQLGGASQLACHTRAVAPGATPTAFAHRAQGRLALATKRLSSRHSLPGPRSEEHTSELQSLMRISYAVFCLKKHKHTNP